ncbi:MAG: extracellular solute-binding protein [Erysipelotrichaceae bacterium]|nr:extracellular solute-binding protein [Erysipelotrichaceae bacterium]
MKKLNLILPILLISSCLAGCSSSNNGEYEGKTLTIYNCEDYIAQGDDALIDIIGEFEKKYGCKVNYYTYDTNETMYNQFSLQKEGTYDLICASEYMVQKMVKEGLVQKMNDYNVSIPNYEKYASKELRNKLKNMKVVTDSDIEVNLDEYAVGYMWGTLGIIYDPSCSDTIKEDVKSWDIFWNENYKDLISIKNSMRDTYVVGLMHAYSQSEEFKTLKEAYLNDPNDENCNAYNQLVQNIFDFKLDGSKESEEENYQKISTVKEELIALKDNIFGFEVDSGKTDIITGKIKMNLAWSGDAVYSIDTAMEESGKTLEYSVPEDGGNIWYDGWTIPYGADKELAYKFLDFISTPENAASNMDYIGYTPFIVGDQLFDLASSWYGISDYSSTYQYSEGETCVYSGKLYTAIQDSVGNIPTNDSYFEEAIFDSSKEYYYGNVVSYNDEWYSCEYYDENDEDKGIVNSSITDEEVWVKMDKKGYDISYLFEGTLEEGRSGIIYPYASSANQLQTQYPSKEISARCAIMNDFGEYNADVIIMWGQVKAYTDMTPVYVFLGVIVVIAIALIIISIIRKNLSAHYKRLLMNKKK